MPDILANNSYRVEDKAASYQVKPDDIGKLLVVTAAATITLPKVADVWNGWNILCYTAVDGDVSYAAETGKLVTFNDVAANSVAFSTSAEKIGGAVEFVYDSTLTKWLTFVHSEKTQTLTVST